MYLSIKINERDKGYFSILAMERLGRKYWTWCVRIFSWSLRGKLFAIFSPVCFKRACQPIYEKNFCRSSNDLKLHLFEWQNGFSRGWYKRKRIVLATVGIFYKSWHAHSKMVIKFSCISWLHSQRRLSDFNMHSRWFNLRHKGAGYSLAIQERCVQLPLQANFWPIYVYKKKYSKKW